MHLANCLSLEKERMQNPISHPLCLCRSRFLCDLGILGGSAACVGWLWGALSEPSICSCKRNLMCLGWIERQVLCSSLGQVCMWEQSVWNLLTQLVLCAALKCSCSGAGSALFSFPEQNSCLTEEHLPVRFLWEPLFQVQGGSGVSVRPRLVGIWEHPWMLQWAAVPWPGADAAVPAVPDLGWLCCCHEGHNMTGSAQRSLWGFITSSASLISDCNYWGCLYVKLIRIYNYEVISEQFIILRNRPDFLLSV